MLKITNISVEKYDLPELIEKKKINSTNLRAIFSKILFNEYFPVEPNITKDQPMITFGKHHCRRCHSRLVIPPTGQFIRQTRRGDEPASILLFCQTCNENQII